MTKWDTIQADVADAYVWMDEEEAYNKALDENEDDIFGFSKAIEVDHLTDDEVEEIFNMFGDK
jgi:hypothetical protein